MGFKKIFLLLLSVFLCNLNAWGQQGSNKIDGGRPDQTQGTSIVPGKRLQVESGLRFQKDSGPDGSIYTHEYPGVTLRLGLLDKLELRLQGAWQDSVLRGQEYRQVRGLGPLGIGARVYLWPAKGFLPEAAFTGLITVPVGNGNQQPDNIKNQLRLGFSHTLTSRVSLAYSTSYGWKPDQTEVSYAANTVFKLTDKLEFYGEVFGNKPQGAAAAHQADAGLLFYPLTNLQLDIAAGLGLNVTAPDFFLTTGVSVRLPH